MLLTLGGLYVALCALVFLFQGRLIFVRGFSTDLRPQDVGLAGEEVWLTTGDGVRLHAWYLPGQPGGGAVLYHHGNAGDVGGRLPRAARLVEAGFSVLLYDYRGYGRSQGRPSESGTYLDGEAGWRHLTEERGFGAREIAHFCESLGSGIGIELAARVAPGAMVVESGFDSLATLARSLFPFLPTGLLLRHRYDNASKVAQIDAPILIAHSAQDEVVPYERGRALFEAAGPQARWRELSGGHNAGGLFGTAADREALLEFLATSLR